MKNKFIKSLAILFSIGLIGSMSQTGELINVNDVSNQPYFSINQIENHQVAKHSLSSVANVNADFSIIDQEIFKVEQNEEIKIYISTDNPKSKTLSYAICQSPYKGTWTLNENEITYVANDTAYDLDYIEVSVTDGKDTLYHTYTIDINDRVRVDEGKDNVFIGKYPNKIEGRVSFIDNDQDDVHTFRIVEQPVNGFLELDTHTGDFIYTPYENKCGLDEFNIDISDATTHECKIITINSTYDVTVTKKAEVFTFVEDISHTCSGKIPYLNLDRDEITYDIYFQPDGGEVTIKYDTWWLRYTDKCEYNFEIQLTDSTMSASYEVTVKIDTYPHLSHEDHLHYNAHVSTPIFGELSGFDRDGDQVHYSIYDEPIYGNFVLNPKNGSFVYYPYVGSEGHTEKVRYAVVDGKGHDYIGVMQIKIFHDVRISNLEKLYTVNSLEPFSINLEVANNFDNPEFTIEYHGLYGDSRMEGNTFTYNPFGQKGTDYIVIRVSDGKNYRSQCIVIDNDFPEPSNGSPLAIGLGIGGGVLVIGAGVGITLGVLAKKKGGIKNVFKKK